MGQPKPAFEAAASQNFFAATGLHALTKTMLFFAGKLFRLVSSFHLWHPLCAGKAFKPTLYRRVWVVVKCEGGGKL